MRSEKRNAVHRNTEEQLVRDLAFFLDDCLTTRNVMEATYRYGNKPPYHSAESIAYEKDVRAVLARAEAWLANAGGEA